MSTPHRSSTVTTLSSGRKKPCCTKCGMLMEGHKGNPKVCPSELVAYNDTLLNPSVSTNGKGRARTRRATTQISKRAASQTWQRMKTTESSCEHTGERMSGSIGSDAEMMHNMPRMATWAQIAFAGAMGGVVVLVGLSLMPVVA
ncbi:hypothetical protein BDZ89DRAFT_497715 [Hymenopellis radicata]|nr:hypothetical protein BDZ89DRAFT_497715 [Hymenopellis radicata]